MTDGTSSKDHGYRVGDVVEFSGNPGKKWKITKVTDHIVSYEQEREWRDYARLAVVVLAITLLVCVVIGWAKQ